MRLEQDSLELERQRMQLYSNPVPEVSSPSEIQRMKDELAAKEAEIAALAAQKSEAEKKANTYLDEANLINNRENEKSDDELRRARLIRHALLIGRVTEYHNDPQVGGFVIIELAMPDLVETGKILAIRRNSGVLGKIKITEINADGAIGSPMPGFGTVPPEVGDELIIPPGL